MWSTAALHPGRPTRSGGITGPTIRGGSGIRTSRSRPGGLRPRALTTISRTGGLLLRAPTRLSEFLQLLVFVRGAEKKKKENFFCFTLAFFLTSPGSRLLLLQDVR